MTCRRDLKFITSLPAHHFLVFFYRDILVLVMGKKERLLLLVVAVLLSFMQGVHLASCMYRLTLKSTSQPTNVLQTLHDRTITECGLACLSVIECNLIAMSQRKCVLGERYGRHGTTGNWNVYEKMCYGVQ